MGDGDAGDDRARPAARRPGGPQSAQVGPLDASGRLCCYAADTLQTCGDAVKFIGDAA